MENNPISSETQITNNVNESETTNIVVAYAFTPKKIDTFITQSLFNHAKQKGINLIPINPKNPIQPNLNCLIHKLYDNDWKIKLQQFNSQNPEIPIIDLPSSIECLHNRDTMLEFIPNLKIPFVGIPNQISIEQEIEDMGFVSNLKLKLPIIAKPKIADGQPDSHKLSLIFDFNGLQKVKSQTPLILQEFVDHNGVLFKIYVAGKHVKCVKRKSLPNLSELDTSKIEDGVLPFCNISNLPNNNLRNEVEDDQSVGVMPPLDLVNDLAEGIREYTKLNLFNIDLIRDVSVENRYLVIDVNYFPGYAKCPGFEDMITEFFLDVVHKRG